MTKAKSAGLAAPKRGDYSAGRAALIAGLERARQDAFVIKPRVSGSEWASLHGVIPKGTSAEPGAIRLYGYQRGLLDAMCDPRIPRIVVEKAARVGYTRLATLAVGYHIEHDPSLCAFVQPTIPDAEDFGRGEIAPMIAETPSIAKLVRPVKQGDARDTLTTIRFTNGASLMLRGAASDDAFRRYSARLLIGDEYDADGWTSGGTEKSQGDKLKLLWTRGETFWNRKMIVGSTPLIEETSRIHREFLKTDQRRYFVPCPVCGEMQFLEWGGPDVAHGVKWELDDSGAVAAVWYVCCHCGGVIDEGHKAAMDAAGEWRPTAKPRRPGYVGFHLWTGMSLNANAAWREIVQEWIDAQADPANLVQPFVNLRLGRPYKLTYGQELKVEQFAGRLEAYPSEVPPGVLFLTAGADVQSGEGKDPRIEVSVFGWGRGHEAWLIGHFVLRGDPGQPAVWGALDELLKRQFRMIDGRLMGITCAAVDSGGHHTAEAYDFCVARAGRRVWAIKGASEQRGRRKAVWPRKPSRGMKGATFYLIGGNAARDKVYPALALDKPGPGYVHFPASVPSGAVATDDEYFRQLTRERRVFRKAGWNEWVKPKEAHEAGVCMVYAYAALCGYQAMQRGLMKRLEAEQPSAGREDIRASEAGLAPAPEPVEPQKQAPRKRRVTHSKFLSR